MKSKLQLSKMLLLLFLAISFQTSFAQVTITATSGTATGSFTTLKLAFDAINAGTHKGVIEIKINGNTTETASASLMASAALSSSAPYYTSINIYPTTTGLSISGVLAAPLINLNGADSVTIDGRVNATGSTKSLTITNTSAAATAGTSTIRFIADATSNTVQYCNLKGSSTDAAAGVVFFSTATTTGNDNNIITNNDITCAADASRPLNAVYALGTTLKNNENNTISNNNIYNFLSKATASQGVNISSYNSGYTISGNSFYETASFVATGAVNYNVITINAATGTGNGFTVSGNYIGGSAALCAGTAWTKTAQNNAFTAIAVTTATGTVNNIQGNTIQNFNWTNAGTSDFTAISLAGATVANIGTTSGNTIGTATGTGSITFTSTTTATDFYGINIASTDVVDCQKNTIGAITAANAAINATNFFGIVKSSSAGTTTISNNTIGSTTTVSSINASSASSAAANIQSVYGIQSAGTGTITISGNTIANMVNATSNATTTALGLISGIYVSAGTSTISNNTVRNLTNANANNSISGTASVSGIVMANFTPAAQTISGNTIYNLSNSNASFAGAVIGIYYSGPTTASAVRVNFIHSLSVTGASSTAADLYGIKIDAGAATYSNNIISLGGDTKTDLFGIYQTGATSNNNSLFYNTVYISGSLVSGATNTSYALYSTATTNSRDFRNNIFVNARSTVSGVSKHYAMYIAASGGTITCNYNNYFVSGTGGVLGYFGADKTALPIVTSNDANSIITNPAFSSTGTTASGFTPTASDTAVTGTGITVDYAGKTRGTYLTIGAFELKQGPNAPTSLVANLDSLNTTYNIDFTNPTDLGGGAITNYEYSLDNGANWITPSPADTTGPIVIEGLTNCTDYAIKIRAVNVTGEGIASQTVNVTTQNGQQAGINWKSRTSAADYNWFGVTYGNGLFVAVSTSGTGNRVMTSPDGITWTSRTSAAANTWSSVTYGNGLFVAVSTSGTGNRVMTSPDGITWTSRTSAADNEWSGIAYDNELFVAVARTGTGNRVMTSADGITWTSRTSAADQLWKIVTYGNGLFVAVASTGTGNSVMTSPDGITWTSQTSAANNAWQSVTYGNGLFVAVAASGTGNRVMTSPDGITWTSRTSAWDNYWTSVIYGNGLFVAVGTNGTGNRVMTSPDGITWTSRTSAANNSWSSVTYGNGLFVAVGTTGTGNRVMTSSDAFAPRVPSINSIATTRANRAVVSFTAPTNVGYSAISNYEYSIDNGSTWVTRSPTSTTSPLTIIGLTNGTTYNIQLRAKNSIGASCASATVTATTLVPIVPNEPTGVTATAGVNEAYVNFTAPTNDGGTDIINYEYTLNDGASWTTITSTTSPLVVGNLANCTQSTIKIRAVNSVGGGAASSPVVVTPQNGQQAGSNWTSRTPAANNFWRSVTYGNGLFVAVANSGTSNRVMTSENGIDWTSRTSAADNEWRSVTYGNGLFVAVANSGTSNRVMTSENGIDWTSRTSAADNNWYGVTYGNGLFVAVAQSGTGNRVMTSPDGITWTSRTSAADNNWYSVTYGNGLFVAVATTGTGNCVMTSGDGITWTSRTSAADNQWTSVTYGNGLFVAVAVSGIGNRVMTSPDGITWTSRTSASNKNWSSVIYGNGLFVAVDQSFTDNRVMTSSDGSTWIIRTSAANNLWNSVTYGNGLFVAVASNGFTLNHVMTKSAASAPSVPTINTIATRATQADVSFTAPTDSGFPAISNYEYSIDNGSTWVTPSPAVTASPFTITGLTSLTTYNIQLRAVNSIGASCASSMMEITTIPATPINVVATAETNAAYIAFTVPSADISSYEYTIDNGGTWTTIPTNSSPLYIEGLTACTEYSIKIRAVNSAGPSEASTAVTVTPQNGQVADGINWTRRTAIQGSWYSLTYGNGQFVAVGSSGGVMTSPDAITWTNRTGIQADWYSVTYGNGQFVAVGNSVVMTSLDGITWNSRIAPQDYWSSITYANGLFVAVGGGVMTSPDGITWTRRTAPENTWVDSVTYGNGQFVAVGGYSGMTSPDGITWTRSNVQSFLSSVTFGNGLFVAAGWNELVTSPDGIIWTSRIYTTNDYLSSVTYGNGLFVVTMNNSVKTSLDGITWIDRAAVQGNWSSITYGNGQFVAVSNDGVMTNSATISPSQPVINSITPTINSASVVFSTPENGGTSAISNYEYSIDNGSTWVTPSPAVTTSPLNITGLTSGTTYDIQLRAENSAGVSCATATVSTTTLSAAPSAPTASAQTFCGSKTVANLAATGTNLQWYTVATGGTALVSSTALASGTYYVSQTISGSESARTSVAVTVNTTPAPTASAQTFSGSPTVTDLAGTGTDLKWYTAATDGTALATSTALSTGTYYVSQTLNSCEGDRTSVAVTLAEGIPTWTGTQWINGTLSTTNPAIIEGPYTPSSSFEVGALTIKNNALVTLPSGTNLTVNGILTVEPGSTLTLDSNANLIQTTEETNSGTISIKRSTAPLKLLDYVLWSSPVSGQQLQSFSLATLSNRFYTYNSGTNKYNAVATPSASAFAAGTGYLIRMPNNHPTTPTIWTGTFTGIPNNGAKDLSVTSGAYNAIGNPYPSTLVTDTFMDVNNITEALYFWRKTNNSANPSYASYTKAGGTGTANSADPNGLTPNGVIQVGQGFIAKATSATIHFTNAMRTPNNANQFLRTKLVDKSRIWLNMTNDSGFFSQTLVAYMDGATSGIDAAIDGRYFNDTQTALTSIINNEEFSIQGRGLPFDASDAVALGFKTELAGTFTLSIDHSDGLFAAGQKVFLSDNLNHTVNEITTAAYTFASEAGVFNTRFTLGYQNTLGLNEVDILSNQVLLSKQNDKIKIDSGNLVMANVRVYDLNGRLLVERKNIHANQATILVTAAREVLLVKITTNEGKEISKKTIN